MSASRPSGTPDGVISGSGQRAAAGASLLQHCGAQEVIHFVEDGVPGAGSGGESQEGPAAHQDVR